MCKKTEALEKKNKIHPAKKTIGCRKLNNFDGTLE